MNRNFIVYLASLELEKLANTNHDDLGWGLVTNRAKKPQDKQCNYLTPIINKEGQVIPETKIEISRETAIEHLLTAGANPLIMNYKNELIIQAIINSMYLPLQEKLQIVNTINKKEWQGIPTKIMNDLFLSITETSMKIVEKDLTDWCHLMEVLFQNGLTFYQGETINSDEINMLGLGKLQFFKMLIDHVPQFDFNKSYIVKDDEIITLTDIANKQLLNKNDISLGNANIEETAKLVKSYSLFNKINAKETISEKDSCMKKTKI